MGKNARASGSYAAAFGAGANAPGLNGTALGNYSTASGKNGTAVGSNAYATGTGSFAAGYAVQASGANSVALGSYSVASGANEVSFGHSASDLNPYTRQPFGSDLNRTLTHVASGALTSSSTDAINGSQLYATNQNVSANTTAISNTTTAIGNLGPTTAAALGGGATYTANGTIKAPNYDVYGNSDNNVGQAISDLQTRAPLQYSISGNPTTPSNPSTPSNDVTLVGAVSGPVALHNVANGIVGAGSTDAVNGSQLYAVQQTAGAGWNLASNGGAAVNVAPGATVDVSAGSSGNVSVTQSGTRLTIDTSANPNFATITTTGGITAGGLTVAAGQTIDMGGNVVGNVAAGALGTTSTDAVNGSQLYATNQAVTAIGAQVTTNTTTLSALQGQINTINQNGSGMFQASKDRNNTPMPTPMGANSASDGAGASASGANSLAMGNDSNASGSQGTAIGTSTTASGAGSTAVGQGANATGDNSVALGAGSVASANNTVSVGSAGQQRQITNVAAGTASTDAATVGQLQAAQAGGVQYDTDPGGGIDYNSVTLNPGGSGPTVIHNVATGVANNDAVNLGQMNTAIAGAVTSANNYTDQRFSELKGNMSQIGNRANAGIASAIAAASLPQPYAPNQSSLGVGVGTFHGEAGIAVGLSKITESGRWVLKANVSSDTRGDFGAGVGAGIVW